MDDLIAFLEARLDEDEAAAQASADSSGNLEWFDSLVQASGDHTIRTRPGIRPVARIRLCDSAAYDGRTLDPDAAAAHIARHDPARVLREVSAIRGVIAMTEDHLYNVEDTYRFFAAIWSDHPDYRAEWAPQS